MLSIFTKNECDIIINHVNYLEWSYENKNFQYYQTFFFIDWVSNKLKTILELEKKIKFFNQPITKVIKLEKGNSLPTHVQNFPDTDITFTIVCFLNNNFMGGELYLNNSIIINNIGCGIIHDRHTKQSISKIKSGNCFLLFSHFTKIIPNKII